MLVIKMRDILYNIRKSASLSQRKMARLFGFSSKGEGTTIRKMERGLTAISGPTRRIIALLHQHKISLGDLEELANDEE